MPKKVLPEYAQKIKSQLETTNNLVDYFLLCGIPPIICRDKFLYDIKYDDSHYADKIKVCNQIIDGIDVRKKLNLRSASSWTPLHIACYRGNYEFVQYLVNLGADIDCKDNDNKTPLFYAVQSDNIRIVKYYNLDLWSLATEGTQEFPPLKKQVMRSLETFVFDAMFCRLATMGVANSRPD